MPEIYDVTQSDAIAGVLAGEIKNNTTAAVVKSRYESNADTNAFTDAEKAKLAGLEGSKFKGTFASLGAIPTVSMGAGDYAHVDGGVNQDVQLAIYDVDDAQWVMSGVVAGETAAQIKTKYESNADTNAFTDTEQQKLADITYAANINSATAAIAAALA